MRDVDPTEQQSEHFERNEAQPRQDEGELRRIVDLIPQTFIVLSPDGKAIYANRVALDYTGLTLDELRAEGWRDNKLQLDHTREDSSMAKTQPKARSRQLSPALPVEGKRSEGKGSASGCTFLD